MNALLTVALVYAERLRIEPAVFQLRIQRRIAASRVNHGQQKEKTNGLRNAYDVIGL